MVEVAWVMVEGGGVSIASIGSGARIGAQ